MSFDAERMAKAYLPHEAKVYDRDDRPWQGEPWPWCPKVEKRYPAYQGQPYHQWPVAHEAIPHDAHSVNEGNTWCRGVPGMIPGAPVSDLEYLEVEATSRVTFAERNIESARRRLKIVQEALDIVKAQQR